MKCVCSALAAVFGFAWRCGLIVVAVALLAAIKPGDDDDGRAESMRPGSASETVMSAPGAATRVVMAAREVGALSECTLVDEGGRQLLRATYGLHGCLNVEWGDGCAYRPRGTMTRDGRFEVRAFEGAYFYELMLYPEGVSGVRTGQASPDSYRGLGFTKEGERVVDPWAIGGY